MDYSKFILEDFNSVEWINNLIKSINPDSLEKELTNIVIKLQFYMQEMNSIVDESTQTAFQSLPKIVREMESVRQEASILQEQMSLIKSDIEKVEKSTQDSVCKLLKIDSQKNKLSQVENALQEADSWTQICDNIDNIMKSKDVNKIADKIASLQRSLSMLSTTPDYEERRKKVQQLCDNFESLLGPQLIQSFFNNDSEFIRLGLNLLLKIDRIEYGTKYYNAWFKPTVQEIWNQSKDHSQWIRAEDLMKSFFDSLLKFCNQELDKHIFPINGKVIMFALIDAMTFLEEQFNKLITTAQSETSDVKCRMSISSNCLQVTDTFCEQLESLLLAKCPENDSINSDICDQLASTLYKQYVDIDNFFTRETDHLVQQRLNSIKMDSIDVSDCIEVLDASIEMVMVLARDLVKNCQSMTHFISLESLLECIKNLFNNYAKEFKRVSRNIILKLSNQQSMSPDQPDAIDNGMDDYYFLQDGIRLTSLGGRISIHFELFLQEMLNQISSYIQKLYSAQLKTNIFFRKYPLVLTNSQSKQKSVLELWKQISKIDSQVEILNFPNFKYIEDIRQYIKFKLPRWLNKKVFENAIEPVRKSLCNIHKSSIWQEELETGEALPQFAFSPQEYITKIGQYFMTLPQQLAPFFNDNNKYYQESLVNGQLPYMSENFFKSWLNSDSVTERAADDAQRSHVAHVWLESIILGCLAELLEQWMSVTKLSTNGRHQMQADLNYITGVVEDLDLQISSDLSMFSKLLVSADSKDTLEEVASLHNIPSKMVEVVRKIIF